MLSQTLQTVLCLAVVAWAASWWLQRLWRSWSGAATGSACGGCSGCPQQAVGGTAVDGSGFVPLATLEQLPHRGCAAPTQLPPR